MEYIFHGIVTCVTQADLKTIYLEYHVNLAYCTITHGRVWPSLQAPLVLFNPKEDNVRSKQALVADILLP